MNDKRQTLDEMMDDYDKERIADIDHWEKNKPQWVKDKIENDRKREIELGLRDADGVWIAGFDNEETEIEEEDEDDE